MKNTNSNPYVLVYKKRNWVDPTCLDLPNCTVPTPHPNLLNMSTDVLKPNQSEILRNKGNKGVYF